MYNSILNKLLVSLFFIVISIFIIISTNSFSFIKNNYESILSLTVLFIGFLVLMSILEINFDNKNNNKNDKIKEFFENSSGSFCEENNLLKLNKKCNSLNKKNCNLTNCCIWLNNTKCVAGDAFGPTFLTDENKNKINIDYYYYKNECKGEKCPTLK